MRVCDKCGWENADAQTSDDVWCTKCNNFLGFPVMSRLHERRIVSQLVVTRVSVLPGGEAVLAARVRNGGDVVEKVSFTIEGDVAGWARVEPNEVGLFPNQNSEVRVVFRPPRSSDVRAGLAPFRLLATSESDTTVSDSSDGTLEVGTFVEVKASLVPLQSAGPSGADHRLLMENAGNTTVDVPVEVSQAGDDLSFAVDPPSVQLSPGAKSEVWIRVSPREALYAASDRRYPFTVNVVAPEQPPVLIRALHVQEALATAPTLVLAETRLHVAPGQEVSTAITIRNRGRGGEDYSLQLLGPAAAWGRVVPPTVVLPSAGEVTAKVVLAPPRVPVTPAADLPFAVKCLAQADSGRSIVVEGLLTVDPVSEIDFAVVPDLVRRRWSSRHVVEVENHGNSVADLRPVVADSEHDLSFAVSPRELRVAAGGRASVVVKARARRPKLVSKRRRRSFQVFLAPATEASRLSSRGEGAGRDVGFEQISVVPRKLAALVAIVLVVAALGTAAILLVSNHVFS